MATVSSVSKPNPVDSDGLCLLSLDGGGVRGLSILFILKRMMVQLNDARQIVNLPAVKPCDVFDLIGGTSTGGLIAIMLGRLEMDVDECIAQYNEIIKDVFAEKKSRFPINLAGKVKARFDSEKLRNSIERVLKNKGRTPNDAFNDGKPQGCRTFVCTLAKESTGVTRLRSYSLPDESTISATICQAALATSAASGFFDEVSIGNRKFVDGALGANNPVEEVEAEAANIWCSDPDSGDLASVVKCFISIGTGNPGKKAMEDNVFKFLSTTLVKMQTETEQTEGKFIARWQKAFERKRYFRMNVDQGLQDVGLAEYEAQGKIETATEEFLRHTAQKSKMRECVSNLKEKKNKTNTNFAAMVNEYTVQKIKQSIDTKQIFWSVPFERNRRFIGRSSQLKRFETALFASDHVSKMAVCGLGGVGKTHIVLEFAHLLQEKRQEYSVFWIAAATVERLQQDFFKLGQALRIPRIEEQQSNAQELVQQYLSRDTVGPWLLVLDNVDDIDIWSNNLKNCLPRNRNGRTILTTRNRKVAVKFAASNVVEVPEMDEATATLLLQKSLMDGELLKNCQETKELLEELTFLPLAIVQAAAYINENGCTLSGYKALLAGQESNVIEILSEDFEDDGRYQAAQNPVAKTWLLSFEQIRRLSPTAADYLAFMSCVDSKDIPRSLLPPGQILKSEEDAIGTLNAFAFCSRNDADTAVTIHRLVHLAMRNWLRNEKQLKSWNDQTISRLRHLLSDTDYSKSSVWRPYLPHTTYILRPDNFEITSRNTIGLRWHFVNILYKEGRYSETERAIEELLTIEKEALGPENPSTLKSKNLLGMTYMAQERLDKAEKLLIDVTSSTTRVLGDEHTDTLNSLGNLASLYGLQGQWERSEEAHSKVLETRRKLWGEENEDTASSLAQLARVYWQVGQRGKSEILEKRALEIREKLLGREHPKTLVSMNSLALTYVNQQKLHEAGELLEKAREICQRVLGLKHPTTINNLSGLASWHRHQGAWEAAEKCNLQAINLGKEVLGEEHPETLIYLYDLVVLYADQNREKEAEEVRTRLVGICKRKLRDGKDDASTEQLLRDLASSYQDQRRWKEAETLLIHTLNEQEKKHGVDQLATIQTMNALASTYRDQARLEEAEKLNIRVLKASEKMLEPEHRDVLVAMKNLALTYSAQGRQNEAEKLQLEVVAIEKRVLGNESMQTLTSMSNLATTYLHQGRFRDSEELQVQIIALGKKVLGEEHLGTLNTQDNLAVTYYSHKQYKKAEELGLEVATKREKKLGADHPNTLISKANLAFVYQEEQQFEEAEKLRRQILEARKRVLGLKHPDTLSSIGDLAYSKILLSQTEDGMNLMTECYNLRVEVLGPDHSSTIASLQALNRWKAERDSGRSGSFTLQRLCVLICRDLFIYCMTQIKSNLGRFLKS